MCFCSSLKQTTTTTTKKQQQQKKNTEEADGGGGAEAAEEGAGASIAMPAAIRVSPFIFNSCASDDQTLTTCFFPASRHPRAHHHHAVLSSPAAAVVSSARSSPLLPARPLALTRASAAAAAANGGGGGSADAEPSDPPAASKYEEYEVELEKPIGLKFYKGRDGGVYIDAIAPGGSADKTKQFTPGDRVIATSAVFGNEMWPAAAYGQTMYTIRQRIGTLAMRMERRFGEREDAAVSRDLVAAERNAGFIGEKVREIQIKNYLRKMELKQQREEDLEEGLKLYKAGQYKEALDKFDSVLGAKPEYKEEAVANYNVACCYSKLNEVEAGLSALEAALETGFEDYKTVRTDPDLANLRVSPKFKAIIDRFDEPFINENALNALKNVFGIFGKQ